MSRHKLLVANRGEIACRIIRAARTLDLPTVAVHSDVDATLPHVEMADEAVCIGPARASESYLVGERLLEAARSTGATLIHPGYGFLSESPAFAALCRQARIAFVGPSAELIRLMGDKHQARVAAQEAGVPVLPGSGKLPSDPEAIFKAAETVGYPLLVKASAGGGGIGMRIVAGPNELVDAVGRTSDLAGKAFGDGSVYLERYVAQARHVEIQVFGFGDGRAVHLFERDCSLQRRHQKVVEEAPAPGLRDQLRRRMAQAAVALASACRYEGAGTIEFLLDAEREEFFFLEMNTRIQVEHPVTEMITGIDLVAAQIRLAMEESPGLGMAQDSIARNGHSIEARVYAENPAKNFIPSPGKLIALDVPAAEHVRFETGYRAGNSVTHFYDPMLMKVCAWGASRREALERLDGALADLHIEGVGHNIAYLRSVLAHEGFVAGNVYTRFLTDHHQVLIAASPVPHG
jgi:3-methylcrotonyl-CoA carboxylase alpha subunit